MRSHPSVEAPDFGRGSMDAIDPSRTDAAPPVASWAPGTPRAVPSSAARRAMWLMLIIYIFNFIDRQVINILAEPISRELKLTNTQIGLMTGLAFAAFYTVLGLPLARIADDPRRDRVTLMSVCLGLWSLMTVACGASFGFGQLLLARMGVGIGEAGCTPTASSLIADLVPRERRSSAMAFYTLGLPIGSLFGLALGGVLSDAIGWRMAFVLIGAPGVLIAVGFRMVVSDPRRMFAIPLPTSRPSLGAAAALREVLRSRAFVLMTMATSATAFLSYGAAAWNAIYLIRTFHLTPGQAGIGLGLAAGIGGLVGSLVGGAAGDRLVRIGNIRHVLTVPAVGALFMLPVLLTAYSVADWRIAVGLLGVASGLGALCYGPDLSSLQNVMRAETRATAMAVKLFCQTLVGLGLGPLAIGILTDRFQSTLGSDALRVALMGSTLVSLVCAGSYWFAGRYLPREIRTE